MPDRVTNFHKSVRNNGGTLVLDDIGAGSRITSSKQRRISSIAKHSSVTAKYGALLYRLVSWYKPASILEFGTGIGISTAYIASGAPGAKFVSIEGSAGKYAFVNSVRDQAGLWNVKLLCENFNECMPHVLDTLSDPLFVFIDGDHRYEPTLEKVKWILEKKEFSDVLLILDDIYWSKEMEQAWKECIQLERISISVDLFQFGILIKRPGIARQHFKVKY